ncbi:hypothetical protein HK099_008199 [Clydaea vesicula]|uniref:Tetratricopeptide repeat protein 27 n=1 Tax=Clydaea vesicula TaxID=447962 RepID=A0AAD5U4T9_9FUNG|nr:hypothetical protein HK099_008199 [Clydaea vesicula]
MTNLNLFELQLLLNKKSNNVESKFVSNLIDDILDGNYKNVLFNERSTLLFNKFQPTSDTDWTAFLAQTIVEIRETEDNLEIEQTLFLIGIACLYSFVQSSFTGPKLTFNSTELFKNALISPEEIKKKSLCSLHSDEEVYHLTPEPLLLSLAKSILVDNSHLLTGIKYKDYWKLRTQFIQQRIMENPSSALYDSILMNFELVFKLLKEELEFSEKNIIMAMIELEFGLFYHHYKFDRQSLVHFREAQLHSGLKYTLSGALGKKTKFQTFDTAQLVLYASSSSTAELNDANDAKLPENLLLDNDTLLEKTYFTEIEGGLLLRSRLESDKTKTVERSALQLQALVDQFVLEESSAAERIKYIFMIHAPSKWEMEAELGERFTSIGMITSALEIYLRLELWENAISCYQALQKEKKVRFFECNSVTLLKAEELVLKQLELDSDSPKLLCILGDLRGDYSLHEKAWNLSGKRFARAMRTLGAHHFKKENYEKSIECYSKALEINPLYENSWFVLGCAGMRISNWEVSIKAFLRVVSLDDGVHLRDAFRALKQSIKCMFDNFKVWENFLYVSLDLLEFREAILAIQRLTDLRWDKIKSSDKAVDIECLDILVSAVINGVSDANGNSATELTSKLKSLLTHITSKIGNSPELFLICAKFEKHLKDYRKAIDFTLKAYRIWLFHPELNLNPKVFEKCVQTCLSLCDTYEELGPLTQRERMGSVEDNVLSSDVVCKDWKYQIKLILKTLVGRTRTSYESTDSHILLLEKLEATK